MSRAWSVRGVARCDRSRGPGVTLPVFGVLLAFGGMAVVPSATIADETAGTSVTTAAAATTRPRIGLVLGGEPLGVEDPLLKPLVEALRTAQGPLDAGVDGVAAREQEQWGELEQLPSRYGRHGRVIAGRGLRVEPHPTGAIRLRAPHPRR